MAGGNGTEAVFVTGPAGESICTSLVASLGRGRRRRRIIDTEMLEELTLAEKHAS